jgi:hypothetical protein
MKNKIKILIGIIIILIIIIIVYFYSQFKNTENLEIINPQINYDITVIPENQIENIKQISAIDPITDYDYKTLYDPFKAPFKRLSKYELEPIVNNTYFNFPTRGYSDQYSQFGYLVDKKSKINDDNKMMKLFGRQKYPNSTEYQYYIMINNGCQQDKYFLKKYNKELYSGDKVYVSPLGRKYKVKLLDQQDFAYL